MNTLELLKATRPDEYAMRERLAADCKKGGKTELLWWQGGLDRVLKAGPDIFTFTISTPTVDRYEDVVTPEGMVNTAFRSNNVVLWQHDHTKHIGNSIAERIIPGIRVEADMDFDTANDQDGLAAMVKGKVADGRIRATSIGFRPLNYEMRYETAETNSGKTQDIWTGGFTFHEWELLEWSIVSIPANPDAVRRAFGLLMNGPTDELEEAIQRVFAREYGNRLEEAFGEISRLKQLVDRFEREPRGPGITMAELLEIEKASSILRDLSLTRRD
jgi:phage head maturation protease